jgi:hypothetical protein
MKDSQKSQSKLLEEKATNIVGTRSFIVTTKSNKLNMTNVLYISSLKRNLISIGAIADSRNLVVFLKEQFWILDDHDHSKILAT